MTSAMPPAFDNDARATKPAALASLLATPSESERGRIVAFGTKGTCTLDDFARHTHALRARLAGGGARYLVHTDDAYAFAVILGALAGSGCVGVLAPNAQPGTLDELCEGTVGSILTGALQRRGAIDPLSGQSPGTSSTTSPTTSLTHANSDRPLVEMFTSGSSGTPDRIVKTLAHLESEIDVLEQRFGAQADSAHLFATVSPQHLYGLLFRVLWPLSTGRPFQRETLLQPEELTAHIENVDSAVVIGTPTHLRVLASSPALAAVAPRLRSIFSSGGPLPFETAAALEQASGIAPTEIFGSTETGGIAYRVRRSDDTPWLLLDGVEIEVEPEEPGDADRNSGRLVVRSPFVSVGERHEHHEHHEHHEQDETDKSSGDDSSSGRGLRFVTGDRVIRVAHTPVLSFRLDGRADRVVQIAEKRISLPELERRLIEHPQVLEAAAAGIEIHDTTRLGVLVVLTEDGRRALARDGRTPLRSKLADALAPYYDRVILPRRWRFVHELPRDEQGKTTMATNSKVLGAPLSERTMEPVLLSETFTSDTLERRYVVPNDLAYLEGHFDGFPLVPGVVQLKWAVEAAQALLDRNHPESQAPQAPQVRSVKFRQVLRPMQEITLMVTFDGDAHRADFRIHDGDTEFSSGRFAVAAGEQAS